MYVIRGKLPNGDNVKMKSDKGSIYDAATEFFTKLNKELGDKANGITRLVFAHKNSADDSFSIGTPAPKKDDKAKGGKKGK